MHVYITIGISISASTLIYSKLIFSITKGAHLHDAYVACFTIEQRFASHYLNANINDTRCFKQTMHQSALFPVKDAPLENPACKC